MADVLARPLHAGWEEVFPFETVIDAYAAADWDDDDEWEDEDDWDEDEDDWDEDEDDWDEDEDDWDDDWDDEDELSLRRRSAEWN